MKRDDVVIRLENHAIVDEQQPARGSPAALFPVADELGGSIAGRRSNRRAETVQPLIDKKSIEFTAKIPDKLPNLNVDKDKISATLVNLLGNAVKYTPDHGRVAIHVQQSPDEIQIHVEDSGFGIAEEELPKVFDQFFRSADERVREISGSGLGLAFAHEVTRMHGGELTVQSELNKGTRFVMTLPLSR